MLVMPLSVADAVVTLRGSTLIRPIRPESHLFTQRLMTLGEVEIPLADDIVGEPGAALRLQAWCIGIPITRRIVLSPQGTSVWIYHFEGSAGVGQAAARAGDARCARARGADPRALRAAHAGCNHARHRR